jgi:hypothetical protein
MQFLSQFQYQVYLQSVTGTKIVRGRHLPEMQKSLQEISDDKGFKEIAEARTVEEGSLVMETQEIRGKRCIVKVLVKKSTIREITVNNVLTFFITSFLDKLSLCKLWFLNRG